MDKLSKLLISLIIINTIIGYLYLKFFNIDIFIHGRAILFCIFQGIVSITISCICIFEKIENLSYKDILISSFISIPLCAFFHIGVALGFIFGVFNFYFMMYYDYNYKDLVLIMWIFNIICCYSGTVIWILNPIVRKEAL
jgi:hypothetical protein